MELVILSGKGGTGKTSLVGSLAVLAEQKVLVDADVDAADLHLLLDTERGEPQVFATGSRAEIITSRCSGCGICKDLCRFEAIKAEPDPEISGGWRYRVEPYSCEGCGVCRNFCPEDAIAFEKIESGQWFVSRSRYGTLVHARLGIAEGNSGKLVSLLRTKAKEIAEKENKGLIIVDGPPGIGCPVIASLTGADYVLLVSEPSKSAFHDLDRILELISHFRIPAGLCLNKYDINPELAATMEKYAADKNVLVLARIPFDPAVTAAQVAGKPLVAFTDRGAAKEIRALWEKLQSEMKKNEKNRLNIKTSNILANQPNLRE
ncbi:MAG: ATP-binding protein [Candidatus Zixiibacteriota bacterium]